MILQIETSAQLAYKELLKSNESALRQHLVYIFNAIQQASSQLLKISDYKSVGFAYLAMLEGKMYQNDNVHQIMTENAFYCLTKAIEKSPNDFTLKTYRLMLYDLGRKSFNDLIICALEINTNPLDSFLSPAWMQVRDAIYLMEIVDLFDPDRKLQEILACKSRKPQYEKMIQESHFGINKSKNELIAEGKYNINKCIKWLESCYSQY